MIEPNFRIPIPVTSRGSFALAVSDSKVFLNKIVGTVADFETRTLSQYFRGVITEATKNAITKIAHEQKLSPLELESIVFEVANAVRGLLAKTILDYGLDLRLFNIEAIKLNAVGATIIVSSGDNGVANSGCNCNSTLPISMQNCACLKDSGSGTCSYPTNNTWTGAGYFPSFPATSPYVVAVGATQGPEDSSTEISCQSDEGGYITSGGGFSTYYNQKSWQSKLITDYIDNLSSSEVPTDGFNILGRGYPDVSLIGVYYQVVIKRWFQTGC